MKQRIWYFTLFLILCCWSPSYAQQLNLKIGYSAGVINPENINRLMTAYDEENPWFEEKPRDLNIINGVTIGFRSRWEYVSLEFSWVSKFASRDMSGIRPVDEAGFEREIIYRIGSFSFGPEFFIGNIGFGGTLDATDFQIRTNYSGQPTELVLVDEFSLSSHFFVSYHLVTSDFLSLTLRPYVQLPYERFNVHGLEEDLFPMNTTDPETVNDNLLNFGLQILFFNGPQTRLR